MQKIALLFILTGLMPAQTPDPGKRPGFEVAAIRPSKDDGNHDIDSNGTRFLTHNASLKRLIAYGYQIDAREIQEGPNWVDSDSYDIDAKISAEFAHQKPSRVPEMVQSLLADRFHLEVHREPRQISGFALVVSKKGMRLERASPDAQGSHIQSRNTHLAASNVSMEAFAKNLSRNRDVGKLVVDKTGLNGAFNFQLDWSPERLELKAEPSSDDQPSIFTALQEQLGLRLEPSRVPVAAIVIDRAEKPGDN